MGVFVALFEAAARAGGAVALLFIVMLLVGIALMASLYLGSAVVVLERFARARRRLWPSLCFAGLLSLLVALALLREGTPELAEAPPGQWLILLPRTLVPTLLAAGVSLAVVRSLIARFDAARLGRMLLLALAALLAFKLPAPGLVAPVLGVVFCAMTGLLGLAWLGRRRGRPFTLGRGLGPVGVLALTVPILLLPETARRMLERAADVGGLAAGALCVLGLLPLAVGGLLELRGTAEWFIARRYLVARRRQVFISAITAICVVGIAAGVWLIIVVYSVMNGFEETWREEILAGRAHFTVHRREGGIHGHEALLQRVRGVPGVVAASPYLDADAMVKGRTGEIFSVRVRGIDPEAIADVNRLDEDVLMGSLDALREAPQLPAGAGVSAEEAGAEPADPRILIGNQLASMLGVGVGDPLRVISPFGGPPTPLGPAPRLKTFVVGGVYRSSFYQYDEVYTYVDLPVAQEFRRVGSVVDGIEVLTQDHYRSRKVGARVAEALGDAYFTRDWKDYFPAFFQALKTERVMMFLLLMMIMVVAAFVIVATLIMMIMEKSGDIAILKAMGAEDGVIERIFALEGTLIGLLGTFLGVVAGMAVTHRLDWIQAQIEVLTGMDALSGTALQFTGLPSRVDPIQVALVVVIAMVLSLGATLLPSRQGARIDPAEGLRHE